MRTVPQLETVSIGPESAGMLLTPAEFDAIGEFDENYHYELIHGVLVVSPIPSAMETGPNEVLGYYLLLYKHNHPQGAALDGTLAQQYVRTSVGRRLADRLIWCGLGRTPKPKKDRASIAVELVSTGKRNRQRDYEEKKREYRKARLQEYWVVDRFARTLTVVRYTAKGVKESVTQEGEHYETPLLPGFVVPLDEMLKAADDWGE